jgi:predicted extracellular nuclease
MALLLATLPLQGAHAISPNAVISQVYGGGGNTGATYTNDFIELSNRGDAAMSLDGWSVQYASAAGTTWAVTALSGTLQPGQYYLVQQAQGAGGTTPLPTPDATGTTAMSSSAGKVALVSSVTPLTGTGCPPDASVVDFVGYGSTANCFEGAGAAPGLSNTTADLRASNGCVETDNNSADFAAGAPNPRNTASPFNFCTDDLTLSIDDVAMAEGNSGTSSFVFTVSLSAPAAAGGVTFDIATADDSAVAPTDYLANSLVSQTIAEGSSTYEFTVTVNGDTESEPSETFFVNVSNVVGATATDGQGLGTIQDDDFVPFAIREIQGASHLSPLEGQAVANVGGIVTAKRSNGFYMQDPVSDANVATSEGIFVFTSSAPSVNVGDAVSVSGTVVEFRPGGSTTANLTTTEITGPSITVLSTGNPLPAATVVGTGGRVPPMEVIDDDATGDVETSGTFDATTDGIDFYESMEGMLVQVNNAVAVGPSNAFGEIPVLGDNGENASVRTNRGGIVIRPGDFNPERIILDNEIIATPVANVADTFPGAVIGVIDYSFGNFKLQVTMTPTVSSGGLAREVTTAAGSDELAIGTFNVENLDPTDGTEKFAELADLIVNHLLAPDIIAVEEIQDNNGPTNDSVVDADATYAALIAAIEAAGGPTYDFRQINPVDDQDGGEPGGNIRVGFLFRTDRGLAFIDRPGGGPTVATTVIDNGGMPELSSSPGRIDPTNTAFANSRKPLVGEFTYNGETVFVVANHFNSKGGDHPLFGKFQPPVLISEVQRIQQAQVVNDFVDSILAVDAAAHVVVAGDLNDFEFSTPINTLEGGVLHTLIEQLPQAERYTYVFEGNSQALDHILVSDSLFALPFSYDIVHVNSEFADQASDHEPQVVRLPLSGGNTAPTVVVLPNACSAGNTPAGSLTVTLDDADGDELTLTLVSNSNPRLIPNQNVVIGGSGDNRTINISARRPGMATLTFEVSDGSSTTSFTITLQIGTNMSQTLTGTSGVDMMFGLGGTNTLNGLGGNDLLCGGPTVDFLNGGDGLDVLDGGRGGDVLNGGNDNDTLRGNIGNDSLTGGAGADAFSGGPGADTLVDFNPGEGDTTDGT